MYGASLCLCVVIKALFIEIRFHLDSLLLLKTELFRCSVDMAPFLHKCSHLFSKTHLTVSFGRQDKPGLLLLAYSNSPVLMSTLQMRLCFAPFLLNSVVCQRIHLAPFLGLINMNAKPKTEVNISVLMQKNGLM